GDANEMRPKLLAIGYVLHQPVFEQVQRMDGTRPFYPVQLQFLVDNNGLGAFQMTVQPFKHRTVTQCARRGGTASLFGPS
ncbi:hypothetical protein, partial [Ralstonia sp.]|uniref:hypothetical protein n=1 Tax=Ralstonia sp. TaxID=54061 RepID=UPI00257E86B7